MDIRFDGKKAIVTGAGSVLRYSYSGRKHFCYPKGFGRGVALKLAECGAEVTAVSLLQEELDELTKTNGKIKTICLDLRKREATKSTLERLGPVNLLVNSAGIGKQTPLGEIIESEMDSVFNIDVKDLINVVQSVANAMKSSGQGGAIVNVSSALSIKLLSESSVNQVSKESIDHLTRSLAVELSPHKIRVNTVNSSFIHTKLTEKMFVPKSPQALSTLEEDSLGYDEVKDMVNAVLFLLSEESSMITGVTLSIKGEKSVSLI